MSRPPRQDTEQRVLPATPSNGRHPATYAAMSEEHQMLCALIGAHPGVNGIEDLAVLADRRVTDVEPLLHDLVTTGIVRTSPLPEMLVPARTAPDKSGRSA